MKILIEIMNKSKPIFRNNRLLKWIKINNKIYKKLKIQLLKVNSLFVNSKKKKFSKILNFKNKIIIKFILTKIKMNLKFKINWITNKLMK